MKFINCFLDEFCLRAREKKLFCFGFGTAAKLQLNVLYEEGIVNRIEGFVDNRCQKEQRYEEYNGKLYKIMSVDHLRKNAKDAMVLITCSDVVGVLQQLDAFEELKDVECFSMHLMLCRHNFEHASMNLVRRCHIQKIPKKIHYCWFGGNSIPEQYKKWMESWRKYCPDYEIIEWNEENYDYKKNEYMVEAYQQKKWAFVTDYVRLDVVYKYGGIYLDTDVELVQNLDELLYQDAFSVFDVQRHVNLGIGFGAEANNELIKEMRDYYDNIHFLNSDGQCDLTTCVMHQYNVLKKYGFHPNGEYQIIKDMAIYPACINGVDAFSHLEKKNPNTYFMHYGTAAWHSPSLRQAREERIQFFKGMCE